MRSIISLFICIIFFNQAFSQRLLIDPLPNDINSDSIIKCNHVKREYIYSYNHEEKNNDSALLTIKFFNELGLCTEIDDIKNGKLYSTTSFQYIDDRLINIESQSTGLIGSLITTYDYDSNGNKIEEKNYTVDSPIVLLYKTTYEYDSINRIKKSHFYGLKHTSYDAFFLYNNNGSLKESIKTDEKGNILDDHKYEYDSIQNIKSEYDYSDYKKLVSTYFYNQNKQLIKEFDYNYTFSYNAEYFQYTNDLLLSFEKVQLTNGLKYYFRFYYNN